MSRASLSELGRGIGEGLKNFGNVYGQGLIQHAQKQKEESRVKQLLDRLEGASDVEKAKIYGEIDPKLALQYEISTQKNKQKQIISESIVNDMQKLFGTGGTSTQPGGNVGEVPTNTQPSFTPSAPGMTARNQTALRPNFHGNKKFNQEPMVEAQQAAPIPEQAQAGNPNQKLSEFDQMPAEQQAATLRQLGAKYDSVDKGSGKAFFEQANAIEKRDLAQQKMKKDVFESERSYASQLTKGFREEIESLRQTNPIKEQAIALARDALASGDVGFFSGSNLAKRTGIEAFESSSGAGLNLAAKEFLVGNLSQVSARAQNKWLEQIMSSAFPRVGQSQSANNVVMEGVQAAYDLGKAKENIATQLEQEDLHNLGFIGKDIAYRVDQALKPESERIMNRLSYRTKVQSENEKSETDLIKQINKKAVPGSYLTRRMLNVMARKFNGDTTKAIIHAKKLGYKIPTNEQVDEWIE